MGPNRPLAFIYKITVMMVRKKSVFFLQNVTKENKFISCPSERTVLGAINFPLLIRIIIFIAVGVRFLFCTGIISFVRNCNVFTFFFSVVFVHFIQTCHTVSIFFIAFTFSNEHIKCIIIKNCDVR